jgi:hypothetical protein
VIWGVVNAIQEFIMIAESDLGQALGSTGDEEMANNIVCLAESMEIETKENSIDSLHPGN